MASPDEIIQYLTLSKIDLLLIIDRHRHPSAPQVAHCPHEML